MLLARTAESVRGGPASVWLWPTAISAGSGRALDGRSERRFPALLVVGGMIPATVRARSSNARSIRSAPASRSAMPVSVWLRDSHQLG